MRTQRRWLATAAPAVVKLFDLAVADGATTIYTFAEASGNLINQAAPGTNDLSVDAAVTRSYLGADPEDLKAYRFPATGSASLFGHAEGTRTNIGGSQAVTFETILKVITPPGADRDLIHFDRNAGGTLMDCNYADANANIRASIAVQGQSINNQLLTTANSGEHLVYAHYVWQWDGTTFRTWRNGAAKASAAIGPGSTGIQSGSAPYNVAFGGFYQVGSLNIDCAIDFFALYPTTHLTSTQIAAHFAASGC